MQTIYSDSMRGTYVRTTQPVAVWRHPNGVLYGFAVSSGSALGLRPDVAKGWRWECALPPSPVEDRGDAESGWTKCLIAGMEVLCEDAAFAGGDPYRLK